jgi:hypothetical protein
MFESYRWNGEAEKLSYEHSIVLSKIIQAGAYISEFSRYYWLNNIEAAKNALFKAFLLYREARDELKNIIKGYSNLRAEFEKTPFTALVRTQGITFEEEFKASYSKLLTSIERIISWIEHLLALEKFVPSILEKRDFKEIYTLIAEPVREIEMAVARTIMLLIRISRFTMGIANVSEVLKVPTPAKEVKTPAELPIQPQ